LPQPFLVSSNNKNLFPDLVNNSLFRNAGATSPQDQFEEALEMIQGKGLFRYRFQEGGEAASSQTPLTLDGRAMLRQLAEGKIEFPLTTPSLQNTSLGELFHNIGFALKDNIEEIDEKIADLKRTTANQGTASSALVKRTEHLEKYKEALETGRHLLQNVPENADINFFQKLMSNLHETFTLCEQAEQERLKGNDEKANNLNNQGLARLGATHESASLKPREVIVAGYNEAFTLCERAQEARAAGNDERAEFLKYQGLARLGATKELASPEPRAHIVADYNDAFTLCKRAEGARTAVFPTIATDVYLYNQGLARLEATIESASPEPREDIVAGYNEAFTLFQNAEEESAAGNGVEAVNLYHQGFARLRAMERLARPAPAASCSIS
jgi:hypothetical protein